MRWLLLAIVIADCSVPRSAERELAQCQVISNDGAALRQCLIVTKNWCADSAITAGFDFQRQIDSLEREHLAQVSAVLARQEEQRQRERDSAAANRRRIAADRQRRTEAETRARLQRVGNWVACVNVNRQVRNFSEFHARWRRCYLPVPNEQDLADYLATKPATSVADQTFLQNAQMSIRISAEIGDTLPKDPRE